MKSASPTAHAREASAAPLQHATVAGRRNLRLTQFVDDRFIQKITHDERVLTTVLYQRKLCTQDTLAELFHVSRRTIGDVVREVGPVLAQDGYTPVLATTRFPNAQAVLDCLAHGEVTTRPPS